MSVASISVNTAIKARGGIRKMNMDITVTGPRIFPAKKLKTLLKFFRFWMYNSPGWLIDFDSTLRSKKREERNTTGACYLCRVHYRDSDNEKNLYVIIKILLKSYCIRCCRPHWDSRPDGFCSEFTLHRITRIEWESLREIEDVLNK